jgi:hypothetical protein
MAATVTQSKGNTDGGGSATSLSATFDSSVAAGAKLIAFLNVFNGGTVSSITSTGATWSKVTSITDTNPSWTTEVWESTQGHSGGGSYQVTANFSSGVYCGMAILELDDAGDVVDFDSQNDVVSGGTVTATSAAIAASASGIHLASMGYDASGATISAGSGWTEVIEVDESNSAGTVAVISRTAVSTVSQTPEWNITGVPRYLVLHIVVEDGAGGGGPTGNPWYYYAQ